jgi:hypothetical protein
MQNEYRIREDRIEGLKHQIDILNRRAAKLGVPAIVVRDTGRFEDKEIRNEITNAVVRVDRFRFIEVIGETPKFSGWTFAALVEHSEAGNILRKAPGCAVELSSFREGAPKCDHCNTLRNRRDTYVLVHDSGAQKQVGSNCIKDFLGHADPHQLAKWAEIIFSVGELCGAEESSEYRDPGNWQLSHVSTMLNYAACAIRLRGYISSQRERDDISGQTRSTKSTASKWMNPVRDDKLGRDYFLPEPQDEERAQVARQFVLDTLGARPESELNDFEHNMLVACKCEAVEPRNIGILAFVPEYYARQVEQNAGRVDAYFGEVGKRVRHVELSYVRSVGFESMYGYQFLHIFRGPGGESIMWKTATELDLSVDQKIVATFTVKTHEEYKGRKQTKVSRAVIEVIE